MTISVAKNVEYVPEWNGNREADGDQIVVLHKQPTMALYDQLIPKPKVVLKVGKEGSEGGETEITVDTSAMVKAMVLEIKGLTFKFENGDLLSIKTGNDLFGDHVPSFVSGLTEELGRHFQELLTEKSVNTKN